MKKILCLLSALSFTSPAALGADASDKIRDFMKCAEPFNPTQRIKDLFAADIIDLKPDTGMDGIPYFLLKETVVIDGLSVMAVGGFDGDDWDDRLYHRAPGTLPPRHITVFVLSDVTKVSSTLKSDYFIEESKYFSILFPDSDFKGQKVTEVTCWDYVAEESSNNQIQPTPKSGAAD